ncbi:pyridoxamine 5'-phosphate oxidase [Streptomyces sp. LX-29]|uniref:pyridoxamine 5'-phosphate oxidase n=1 Tax=Streptomyces sp. LX-29 TaxID=2900152 RepID=UPI00240CF1D1|nr:pyridoxamine 5'-phosphate oxidase [Streptomyces sp. LX-29]WFB09637.1 pyridoxamine 5'-phosphate oxidase [Streptomyces sp. LX-29]
MTVETTAVRSAEQRRRDLLERLEREEDIWVASADSAGVPCLVALSFLWDGEAIWLSTRRSNPTGRNLGEPGRPVRLSLAHTRDVALLEGRVADVVRVDEVPAATANAFAAKAGWDPRHPRNGHAYAYHRVLLTEVQVWHEIPEMPGRHLMRGGVWTV